MVAMGQNSSMLKGMILDEKTQEPLPYTNILVLHQYKGTVSNENGNFSLDITDLNSTDSISFQFIGYQTKKALLSTLDSNVHIYLKEDLINLSEAFVYGNPPNPKDIIKKVLENKEQNYKRISAKSQTFMRSRDFVDIHNLSTDMKKNSIDEITEEMLHSVINKVPRHITSFTDFLGYIYTYKDANDSIKITAEKTISLQEEDYSDFEQFGKIFEKLFKETEEDEYWKVKSGIFADKIEVEEETKNDSIQKQEISKDSTSTAHMRYRIKNCLNYAYLEDSKEWEFLHKPGKYKYELTGGTRVNGEDVFIIDFSPKSGGLYRGRVYISSSNYALIKADYEYAVDKTGKDLHLLGIGYTEDQFKTSIYFEKYKGSYQLKYLSKTTGISFSVNRNIQLLKKRKRFLRDKKLKEFKIKLNMAVSNLESVELLFLNQQQMKEAEYAQLKQHKKMKVTYINHFSDDLWKGYPIIEPTKQMREYQKQEVDW